MLTNNKEDVIGVTLPVWGPVCAPGCGWEGQAVWGLCEVGRQGRLRESMRTQIEEVKTIFLNVFTS